MPPRKRSASELESDRNTKRGRGIDTVSASEKDLAQANARIHELEAQVRELQDYINESNLAFSKYSSYSHRRSEANCWSLPDAPDSIRQQLDKRDDAATNLAKQVRSAIAHSYNKLEGQTYNAKKTGVTSDDLSEAMTAHFKDIEKVRNLPGGLTLAFDLVLYLGECSFAELDMNGAGYGDRPSDNIADDLLYDLTQERKRYDPVYNLKDVLSDLKGTAKTLSGYGIDSYFPRSIELLTKWETSSIPGPHAKLFGASLENAQSIDEAIDEKQSFNLPTPGNRSLESRKLPLLPLKPRVQLASKANRKLGTRF